MSTKELESPDMTQVGLAFAQAITFINYQPYPDLDEAAREWLIKAGKKLTNDLKIELAKVQDIHLNPSKFASADPPKWALDSTETLCIWSPPVPYILSAYKDQFQSCIRSLLEKCGLEVVEVDTLLFTTKISCTIKFREAGLKGGIKSKPANLASDKTFMGKFLETANELKIEKP